MGCMIPAERAAICVGIACQLTGALCFLGQLWGKIGPVVERRLGEWVAIPNAEDADTSRVPNRSTVALWEQTLFRSIWQVAAPVFGETGVSRDQCAAVQLVAVLQERIPAQRRLGRTILTKHVKACDSECARSLDCCRRRIVVTVN